MGRRQFMRVGLERRRYGATPIIAYEFAPGEEPRLRGRQAMGAAQASRISPQESLG
jgi:hypothetical protein